MALHASSSSSKLGGTSSRHTDLVTTWLGLFLVFVFLKRQGWEEVLPASGRLDDDDVLGNGVESNELVVSVGENVDELVRL